MPYATLNDIITLYGKDQLHIADRNGDGMIDEDAVERALELATGEINSHIGVRWKLPLKATPAPLPQLCVDIAIYRLALSHDVLSEEIRARYEDAIEHLKLIAAGRAALVFEGENSANEGEKGTKDTSSAGPSPIVSGGPDKEFSRDKLGHF